MLKSLRTGELAPLLLLFLATFIVFRLSPIRTIYDSRYSMMFAENLLRQHSFSLDGGAFPELRSRKPGQIHVPHVDLPYHLVQVGERFYYIFPPGSFILSMPYVALANALGISAFDQNGMYNEDGERQIETGLAALLMAGLSVIIFLTARLVVPLWASLVVSLVTAFGTQVWSTASRAVWTHTWGIFILSIVIWQLVRSEVKQVALQPVVLASCLGLLFFVRSGFSVAIVGIALYVFIYHRRNFLAFALTGVVWFAAFTAYARYCFGSQLPAYELKTVRFMDGSLWPGLLGTLFSPSRGLFIFVPFLLFIVYLLIRYRDELRPRLPILALAVIVCHLLVTSKFRHWHAGHGYGPRYATDLVPWFSLLAILALEARLRWRSQNGARDSVWRAGIEWSVATFLVSLSVTINGIAAFSLGVWLWNARPTDIMNDTARLWDWKHPQFLGVPR